MRAWVVVVMLAGCVHSQSQECGDGRVCPQGDVCDATHTLCVSGAQAINAPPETSSVYAIRARAFPAVATASSKISRR